MASIFNRLQALAASRAARWVGVPLAAAVTVVALVSQSQTTLPTINLAAEPLYARGARAKPTLTLDLSVEFPTVGAQYRNATYSPDEKYIGYFDTESCYTYDNASAVRRFVRSSAATSRTCGGNGFSGNFMNWATGSAIDVLRYGLTGGDRVVDDSTTTVLQRAVLPNNGSFYNGSYFPSKVLPAALVNGALPATLKGSHTGDVYVANCLNRVNFGTAATGSCDAPGDNSNLGASAQSGTKGPITSVGAGALPGDFSSCASSGNDCSFTGIRQVAYGNSSVGWKYVSVKESINCSSANFGGSPGSGTKACYSRPDPTGWNPSPSSATLSSDFFFYARVQVCESSAGVLSDPRTSLCLRYPNGNFKPVGNLQRYSDRVRIAAFGYLNDNTGNPNERYGGVLRAPMKYVGPKTFNANFALQSGTNGAAEWNENTGQFLSNPENQTSVTSGAYSSPANTNISGVINYLNQFGRTGTNQGQYKTYDPVGELYYESVRYLQGLTPTSQAVSGLSATPALKDGFPVYDTWTDPHPAVTGMTDYSCVKNNIVGIGDVFTHWDKSIPGNANRATAVTPNDFDRGAGNDANNEPNFHYWTRVVGGFESDNSVTYTDGKGVSHPIDASDLMNIPANSPHNTARWGLEDQTTGSGNSSAYYMAGVAYWANTHDIRGAQWSDTDKRRPGMRVTTYMIDVNENSASSNNVSNFRTNTHFYLAAKYGGFKDTSGTGNPFKVKNTDGTTTYGNSNWAGSNGEAKNYFLASSAQALLDALDEIFANIASEANSIAGGAISTQRLTTTGGNIYQAQFDPADWSGDLIAYPVSVSASSVVTIGVPANSPWRNAASAAVGAAGKLDDLANVDARKIYVGYNSTAATPVFDTTEFKWSSLNTVTQEALRMPPYAASAPMDSASAGESRLNYLRGDRSLESTGTFRRRGSRLGDIVNSGVAYSGTPALISGDSAYASFRAANLNRKKALYVGANDGMLHAFDADTGSELFAYIPSWLVPRLPALTSTSYVHAAYLDGSPEVAEAKVGSVWKTVLVSGSGGGGQGVFALDVSDPDAFGDSKVMWEFTDRHDAEMGNVIGHPKILKLNTNAGGTTPSYKYFAVFASGVNNYADDGYALATTDTNYGSPVLFLLDLSKPKSDQWALGTNYYKVRFPVASTSIASGMAEFAVRLGSAGELTYVYAGDMQGNLWKLDFTATTAANWSIANLSYFKDGSNPIPMFIARDAATTPNRQPISMEPALVFGSNRSIIVSFGTGKYLETSDNSGPYKAQSVYTLLDNNTRTNDTASPIEAAIAGRGSLAQATVTASSVDVPAFGWGRTSGTKAGWYFDFYNADTVTSGSVRDGTGERQVSTFGVLSGKLIFGTVIPALNSCDNGSGNLYILDMKTGDGTSQVSSVGILGEPFVAQVGTSTLTNSDTTGRRNETTRYQVILQGSAGLAAPPGLGIDVIGHPGRLSWREISNYQELRNAP